MIQRKEKRDCCGCTACYNACPKRAIAMEPDIEGFLYPEIDQSLCIDCGLCEKVCPVLHRNKHKEETKGYIVRLNDEEIVDESTSGGAFTAFAIYLMKQGYVVYGAGYDENMRVICKEATTPEGLKEMRGSKFVQSTMGTAFQDIKWQLKAGQGVLFTGTPCQVAGLIGYLGGKPENLICIDFVCRGVPSPGLWKNYVDMMEKKYGSKIVGAKFKHKTYGYHATTMKVDFANGKTWYGSGRVDPMMKAFVSELASRPSCHACAFKSLDRVSDITIFDCYRFNKITGFHDDDKGYSSILIHTHEGKHLLNCIWPELTVFSTSVEKLERYNGIMIRNSAKTNPKREIFYTLITRVPIDMAINAVSPITSKDYLIEKAKQILYKSGVIHLIQKVRKNKDVEI